jgi:hypothetical protein
MTFSCPRCGATFASDETCQARFNTSQLKEVEQPSYFAVHHLSVPCYMLQHNVYSREGWLAVSELLFQFIHRGLTPAMARQQNHMKFDSRYRTWSIIKGAKFPGVENIKWTYTIADVQLDTAETYCADVRRWAQSILENSEQLSSILGNTT